MQLSCVKNISSRLLINFNTELTKLVSNLKISLDYFIINHDLFKRLRVFLRGSKIRVKSEFLICSSKQKSMRDESVINCVEFRFFVAWLIFVCVIFKARTQL